MTVFFEGQAFEDGITALTFSQDESVLGLLDVDGNLYDLRDKLSNISVKAIKYDSPDAAKVISGDTCLALAIALEQKYNCEVIECVSDDNLFHCDFYNSGEQLSSKEFDSLIEEIHSISSSKLEITRPEHGIYEISGRKIRASGPLSRSTARIVAEDCKSPYNFILTSISGLHDDRPAQRITGAWFKSSDDREAFIKSEEEAKEFDHRILGPKLGIFRTDPELMLGMITWLPNGTKILEKIKSYIRNVMRRNNYQEVITPPLADISLWQKSGHWELFKENMLAVELAGEHQERSHYAMKPMNCPLHIEIFKHWAISYKNLPCRISEFGFCTRYEASGSLHGLFRARGFTQDDAHVFCEEHQINEVIFTFCQMLKEIYTRFSFNEISVCLSTRPDKFAGSKETWKVAEESLADASRKAGLEFKVNHGDGAFYGPKLDFYIKDSRDRVWQCGTVQLDFVLPGRLGATYVGSDGSRKTPVMIHHAVLGSLERFIGVLLEHTKGRLPFWLSPNQIVVIPVKSDCTDYAEQLQQRLTDRGFSAKLDAGDDTINYKIRRWWSDFKVPVMCIVGNEEKCSETISLRINGTPFGKKVLINEMFDMLQEMERAN